MNFLLANVNSMDLFVAKYTDIFGIFLFIDKLIHLSIIVVNLNKINI